MLTILIIVINLDGYAWRAQIWATVGTSLVVRIRGIQTWRLDPKGVLFEVNLQPRTID